MRAEIGPEEVLGVIRSALEAKYGDKFDLGEIALQVKRPKGAKATVGAVVDLLEKQESGSSPSNVSGLSAVRES